VESYAQRKNAVLRQVRILRRALTGLNTALEKARREADRLSERKTLISPESLETIQKRDDEIFAAVNGVQAAEAILNELAASYL